MRTFRPYLPALTLSLCACSGDPSPAKSANPSETQDAGASSSALIDTDDSLATSSAPASLSSTLEHSDDTPAASSTAADSTQPGVTFETSTSVNASDANAEASSSAPNAIDDVSSQVPPKEEPPLSAPLGTRNFACDASPSPMFQSQEVLEMRITADFSVVNGNDKDTAISPGSIDPDGAGPLAAIPVDVQARGISRFRDCGFRPFKVRFAEKQKDNVFHKLGKSVKFSTHCGDREGMHDILKAPSLDEYYQRVRMEHLVYQLIAPLETMSLATRLVRVTYEDTSTGSEETHLAFVREPEDELGQRCGMAEGEDIPDVPTVQNERSNLMLYLINNFVIQADVKNRFELVDVDKQLRSSVPYDFDLLGIFRREYLGLDGRTLTQNAEAFADWLRRNQSPALHEEVDLVLSKGDVMRQRVADAELTTTNRALFDEWLDAFLGAMQLFNECETSEQDPSATACYVPDDHAGTIEDAATIALGEQSLLLEPPGDQDVVRVDFEPGTLYTLNTPLNASLRSPDGSIVGALGEQTGGTIATAISLRTDAGGTYSIAFDRGSLLVCSDMWSNSAEGLAQPYAVYEDDHGGTLATATQLQAGVTAGYFELSTLQGLFDEDWYTVTIGADTQLFVDYDGFDSAFLEVYPAEDATVAIDTYYFNTQGAREEITAIFPAPGEYLVRAIQGWDQASYSLEVLTGAE